MKEEKRKTVKKSAKCRGYFEFTGCTGSSQKVKTPYITIV
jgi:hypothetical protein